MTLRDAVLTIGTMSLGRVIRTYRRFEGKPDAVLRSATITTIRREPG